jgi:hypothetical protein
MGDLRGGSTISGYPILHAGTPHSNVYSASHVSGDGSYVGDIITLTAGATIGYLFAVYMTSTGVAPAAASTESNMPAIGLALNDGPSGIQVNVLTKGLIKNSGWSFTKGAIIYLNTTAGYLTQSRPSTAGQQVQIMGIAVESNVIYINPQLVWVQI